MTGGLGWTEVLLMLQDLLIGPVMILFRIAAQELQFSVRGGPELNL